MARFRRRARRSRFPRRRRFNRYTPWYKRKYSAMSLASSAFRTAKWLKKMVNVEKKVHDISTNNTIDTSGTITHLTAIAQGDDLGNRSGNSIKLVSQWMRASLQMSASATETLVRIMVVIDTQQISDTTPSISDVLTSAGPLTPLNPANLGRFTSLYDRLFTLSSSGSSVKTLKHYFNLSHHVRFNNTTGSDIQKGGIYLIVISNEAVNTPTVNVQNRIRYVDN